MSGSKKIFVWSPMADLKMPECHGPVQLVHLPTNGTEPAEEDLARINIYIPMYMGGAEAVKNVRNMPNLQIIQSLSSGVNEIVPVRPETVTLCNARGVHDTSTAELALGLTIAARRGFADFGCAQWGDKSGGGHWATGRYQSLADSKVAIVGYGSIGRTIHRLLEGFALKSVVAFTRSSHLSDNFSRPLSELDEVLPSLDVVILILPLNDESQGLFNARRLALMKDGATLVNVARGQIVDTDALISELEKGRLSAGLDVTDPEPLPDGHPLWRTKNCIITPHVGGNSSAFESRGRKLVQEQLQRFAQDMPLENVIVYGAGPL
jgi:phosphoglycerate dehydrogenase-like enzyme